MVRASLFSLAFAASPALAHDQWADGSSVPAWVKAQCCGPEDVHHLRPDQVERSGDFYVVAGYRSKIPASAALPSQDGDYWIFYKDYGSGQQTQVYCFFVPMSF